MPGAKSNPVFRYFENLIDPFRDAPDITLAGTRAALLRLLPVAGLADLRHPAAGGLAGALVEVALFSFLADTVDMAQHTAPADFSANTPTRWCGWRSW